MYHYPHFTNKLRFREVKKAYPGVKTDIRPQIVPQRNHSQRDFSPVEPRKNK